MEFAPFINWETGVFSFFEEVEATPVMKVAVSPLMN